MTIRQLLAAPLGALLLALAPTAWSQPAAPGQDKPEARQQAKPTVKGEPSAAARKATGLQGAAKEGQPANQPDRREKAMQTGGSLLKKTNETSSAAASNVK